MKPAPRFGVAGNPPHFKRSADRGESTRAPHWLAAIGLDAYEYEAVHGVTMTDERARTLGEAAWAHGIVLSVHAPYYTNLASLDPSTAANSIRYLRQSVHLAATMGARVVVLHPGWYKGHTNPATALDRCLDTLSTALVEIEEADGEVLIAPETCGLKAQVGSLDEILVLCTLHPRLVPCLDFAHIHARANGRPFDDAAFDDIFSRVERTLGRETLERAHIHYYPVEYADRGERCHHAFDEPEFGPRPEPFIAALHRWNLTPTVICESRDKQDIDALLMKKLYGEKGEKGKRRKGK